MNPIHDQFDEIVKSHPKEIKDAILFLEQELASHNCKFGETIIPTFLKPLFLHQTQAESISAILTPIVNILEKVVQLYFTEPKLREYFYLDKKGSELMNIDHGYSKNIIIARPDSFLVNGTLRFIEFNCDSPAGAGYCDIQEKILANTFPFRKLSVEYHFQESHRMENLLGALLTAWEEFDGKGKRPNIAIIDWQEMRTHNEFGIIQKYFKEKGYDTIVADPRELKWLNGRLECKGFPIDLVYRRAIFKELIERFDEVQDFITAYRKGKVCVVNPFRSRLASNKAILSIITNQKDYKKFFTDEENRIIQKHIPWTRRVMDIQTHFDNNLVFLRKHIINHKDHLVLKPADSYGGKDVVIGRECDQVDWEILVNRILKNNEDWVVQRYVDITEMTVPVRSADSVTLQTKKFNINPFIFGGRYAGSMARLSDQSVINVSAGGGLVPAIQYTTP